MNRASRSITLLLFGLLAVTARAQNASPASSDPNDPTGLWNSDVMMEQATINISRRYNLDDAQEEFTRQLLRKRTTEFLEIHEDELRKLLKDMFISQLRGETPNPEQARVWGQRAEPLLDEARKAILDGAFVLDVREPDEWGVSRIEDALHIPLGSLRDRSSEVPRDRPVLAYCGAGQRSSSAASVLERAGIEIVMTVRGGFSAWVDAGEPVVT